MAPAMADPDQEHGVCCQPASQPCPIVGRISVAPGRGQQARGQPGRSAAAVSVVDFSKVAPALLKKGGGFWVHSFGSPACVYFCGGRPQRTAAAGPEPAGPRIGGHAHPAALAYMRTCMHVHTFICACFSVGRACTWHGNNARQGCNMCLSLCAVLTRKRM